MKKYIFLILVILAISNRVFAEAWTALPIKPAGQTGQGGEGWQKGFDCKFAPSNPNIVYRVNDTSGVWKSTDGGETWNPVFNGFRFLGGNSIAIYPTNPDIVLVAGSDMNTPGNTQALSESGISRTIDGGANWITATSTANGTTGSHLRMYFIRRTEKTNDLIHWVGGATATAYAGTKHMGILKSQDYGYTWSVLVPVATTGEIYDMDLRGTGTGQNKIVVASANGLLQFTDNGVPSATNIGTGISGTAKMLEISQTDTNKIWVTSSNNTLYKSTTGTPSFSTSGIDNAEWSDETAVGVILRDFRMSDADNNKLFLNFGTTSSGYWFYTSNGGTDFTQGTSSTWDSDGTVALFGSASEANQSGHRAGTFIATNPIDSTQVLVQNGWEQTLKSTNSGVTFSYSNEGYMGYAPYFLKTKTSIAFIPGSTTVARAGNDFCWWMSNDGVTWVRKARPSGGQDDSDSLAIEPGTTTPVILLSYFNISDSKWYIQKSTNWGASWSKKTPNMAEGNGFPVIRFNNSATSHVYAGKYKSSDKGDTWVDMGTGVSDIVYNNNNILYSITSSGSSKSCTLRRSTNGTATTPTWSNYGSSFDLERQQTWAYQTGEGLAVNCNDTLVYVPAGTQGVYVLSSGTPSLKNAAHGLTVSGTKDWNYKLCVTDPLNANVAYAMAYNTPTHRSGGIFRTTDGGNSWVSITDGTGLGSGELYSMAVNPNNSYLYAFGYCGAFIWNAGAPVIDITVPTTLNWYGTTSASLTVSGNASSEDGLDYVNYVLTGDTTGVGTATGTVTWSIASLGINTGTTTVTVTATDVNDNSTSDVIVLNRSAISVDPEDPDMIFPYTDNLITVDGSDIEAAWGSATSHPMDLTIEGVVVGTVTGIVKGMWNENYLYVLVVGTDTTKNNDTGTTTPHLDTGVEVYLDALRNKGSYGLDDFHFNFPWNQSNFIHETNGKTTGVLNSMSSTANGYTLEVAIPWTLTTIAGTNSTPLGMDFQQNIDIDGGNTRESAKDAFNAEDTNYLNMDNVGFVVLGTKTAQAAGGAGSSTVTKLSPTVEWKFNGTTTTCLDSVGTIHGTITGVNSGTASVSALYGNGISVVGSTSVNFASPATLDTIGTRTTVILCKPTASSGAICGKHNIANSLELSNTNTLWFIRDFVTTDLQGLGDNNIYTLGEYSFFVHTWDGGSATSGTKFYVNGSSTSNAGGSVNGVGGFSNEASLSYFVGNRQTGANPFSGIIDNIQHYIGTILTTQQILDVSTFLYATTTAATSIGTSGATLNGTMQVVGSTTLAVGCFDYGTVSGVYTGSTTVQNTGIVGSGSASIAHVVTGLPFATTIYYRARVDNPAYQVYGTETSFSTLAADATVPTIQIVSPVASGGTYSTTLATSDVYGSSSDNVSVNNVVWLNQTTGTSGACSGTTQWNKLDLPLQEGTNTIKATAFDTSGNQGTATIDIVRSMTTPSILISTPVNNCTDVDGNRVFGTPSTNITITGTAYDVSGIGTVTVSLTGTTTVHVASGTSTWTTTGTVTCTGSNTVSATAFDPLSNQGTDTMKIGNYPVPVTGDALSVTRNSALLIGTVTINDAGTTAVSFDYGTTEGVYVGSSSTQTISGTSVTDGLVFWAKLDETSGNAVDITSGNVGTRTGGLQNQAGKISRAYYFDGVDDCINFGDPADGKYDFGTDNFSLSFWLKNETTTTSIPISKRSTTGLGYSVTSSGTGIDFRYNYSSTFNALGQTSRDWRGMTTHNNNVYACVYGGDIYMQTNGTGTFNALGQTSRDWRSMTTHNNNVYACVSGGDIYMQTNGTGTFNALGQTSRGWLSMTTHNNNVYACVYGGDIYMQTNGTGTFNALGQTSRDWCGMTTHNNNVYACVYSGDIYMQTNGTGTFNALGQTSRDWLSMTTHNNNVYACVSGGDIYMQTNGTGTFNALGQTSRDWRGMTTHNNNVYACVYGGDIYMQTASNVFLSGTPIVNTWTHYSVTCDRNGGTLALSGYNNGNIFNSWTTTDTFDLSNALSLNIGRLQSGGAFFGGYIDDVRMYNRALSATEVLAIYNEGVSGRQASVNIPLGSLNKTTQYYYRLSSTGNYETTYGEEEGFITLDGIVTNGQFARTELWPPYSTRFIKFLKDNALWPVPFKKEIRSTQDHVDLQSNPDEELSNLLD